MATPLVEFWEIANSLFTLCFQVPACCSCLLVGNVVRGGQEIRFFGKGESGAPREEGSPKSKSLTNLIGVFIQTAPLRLQSRGSWDRSGFRSHGLDWKNQAFCLGSCRCLRLFFLFWNNNLFNMPYLFFPSTQRNDEVTGPR